MAQNPYEALQQRNARLVELLERNHHVSKLLYDVVDHLLNYADHRGIRFEDIRVEDTSIVGLTGDEYLQARLRHL